MNQPLVSVLIANYNHEDTITETLQSVLNQTYKNMQIIVIDDGSTDESWNLINQFEDRGVSIGEESTCLCGDQLWND
mgnify:CR=1 FL=1